MTFDADSPEDAVRQMVGWLGRNAGRVGMRVIQAPEEWTYVDAEDVMSPEDCGTLETTKEGEEPMNVGDFVEALADHPDSNIVHLTEEEAEDAVRRGVVHGAHSLREVQAYMPNNYSAREKRDGTIIIEGTDVAGWTMGGYVIPRLASGNMRVEEIA